MPIFSRQPRTGPESAAVPASRTGYRAEVTAPTPERLKAAARYAARKFFAGCDTATLEIEPGWVASRHSRDEYAATIIVWCPDGMPAAPCPSCHYPAALAPDGRLAEHDERYNVRRCAGSGGQPKPEKPALSAAA